MIVLHFIFTCNQFLSDRCIDNHIEIKKEIKIPKKAQQDKIENVAGSI
jgi:hypothetical protein